MAPYVEEHGIDFVIVNGENAAQGSGLTENLFKEIVNAGAVVVTAYVAADGERSALLAKVQYEKDWAKSVLQSVCRIQRLAVKGADPKKVFDCLLGEFLRLTDSEYGFIGEVFYSKEKRQKYLKTRAITNIAWDQATRVFYEEHAPDGLEFFNLDTLFGHVIRTEETVLSNAPGRDPRAGGLPPGHPAMSCFLGLPLADQDGMVGMVGLANSREGYSEKVIAQLEPLLNAGAQLLRAHRAQLAEAET
ncbi:MAG: YmdB family metallophosphoesterase, partial [Planctomycetota bacterium]